MDEEKDGLVEGRMGCLHDGSTKGWKEGKMDGWIDRWLDG